MDPLSITASIVALIGVCRKLTQGLTVLRQLSHIPEHITALLDELQDFRNVLDAVRVVAQQRHSLDGVGQCSDELKGLLLKASDLFASIASHCGISIYKLRTDGFEDPSNLSGQTLNLDLLSRFRWLKDKRKVDVYRRRLEVLRLDIANHLAALSLVDSCSLLLELRGLATAFRRQSIDHSALQAALETIGSSTSVEQSTKTIGLVAESNAVETPNYQSRRPSATSSDLPRAYCAEDALSSCSCSCHRALTLASPSLAHSVFGSFSVKVQGIDSLTPRCNEVLCRKTRRSAIRFAYRFPSWLLDRGINSVLYNNSVTGPQLSLSSVRIVPRNSDVFCLAMEGDIDGMKKLFTGRLASPFDATHNYGYTALHYAIEYGHVELGNFLLQAGASPEVPDFNGTTALDLAYNQICTPTFDKARRKRLQSMFDDEAWLEQKQFNILHKVILHLTRPERILKYELQTSTRDIDVPDADGRTPISWAAARSDYQSTVSLLGYGADVNRADKDGNSPIHYACKAPDCSVDLLSALLCAGASASKCNRWGQTPLSWVAFFQDDPELAKVLLTCPLVSLDDVDNHGSTLTGNAAFNCKPNMLRFLLEAGSNPNVPAYDSCVDLIDCISRNNHESLAILLQTASECPVDADYKDDADETCLHYLARRANPETASIFLKAVQDGQIDVSSLNTAQFGKAGLTARDLLKLRGHDEVHSIVEEILHMIEQETASQGSDTSDEYEYMDSFESLPLLEKGVGMNSTMISIQEVLDV